MSNFDTKHLHVMLTMASESPVVDMLPLIQAYHLARCADALERLADHIENGQIATLDGQNIVNGLTDIRKAMGEKK